MNTFSFNDKNHFLNFLKKYSDPESFSDLENEQGIDILICLDEIFHDKSIIKRFTYLVLSEKPIINSEYLRNTIIKLKSERSLSEINELIFERTINVVENQSEFLEFIEDMIGKNGVYIFSSKPIASKEETLVYYVGVSSNLATRIPTSLNIRKKSLPEEFYIEGITSYNKLDSAMIEIYLINLLRPILNTTHVYGEKSTLLNNAKLYIDYSFKVKLIK